MSALREAAAKMRERAQRTAVPHHPYSDAALPRVETTEQWCAEIRDYLGGSMGVHAASWHPDAAQAAAALLEVIEEDVGTSSLAYKAAEAFAHAYLGRDS